MLAEAGLPRVRVHDLRHSAATLLLEAGVHPRVVAERLGHASPALVMNVYGHVTERLPGAGHRRARSGTRGMTETSAEFIARQTAKWERERERAIRTKDVGRQGYNTWIREAWTFHQQHNYAEKVLVIERLRRADVIGVRAFHGGAEAGDIEYRFGYYIVGRIGRAAGRWTWGQFSPFIPHADLYALLDRARAEGTLLP